MNDKAMAVRQNGAEIVESVLLQGDLSKLSAAERVTYYKQTCESLGLNPLTKPFDYILLNNKLTLYAKKDATDQLRGARGVSIVKLEREQIGDLYVVTAYAKTPDGRSDSSIGAVNVAGLRGENLANALMKAETKAKRRVTLSICGLGWTDESEVASISNAQPVAVDLETGELQAERASAPVQVYPGSQPTHDQPDDPLITKPTDRRMQRYSELYLKAKALDIEAEVVPCPVKLSVLTEKALRLKERIEEALASRPEATEEEADEESF